MGVLGVLGVIGDWGVGDKEGIGVLGGWGVGVINPSPHHPIT